MDTNSADNFEYILQLTRLLSSECMSNREQNESLLGMINRLAGQSGVSFNEYSSEVSTVNQDVYNEMTKKSETQQLLEENYDLLYQIEQQEYINSKMWSLLSHINEHINSLKLFLVEERIMKKKKKSNLILNEDDFKEIELSTVNLENANEILQTKIEPVIEKLRLILSEVDLNEVDQNKREFIQFCDSIRHLNDNYDANLIIPNI